MSDGILGNLKDAWGVEDDGPNPETLSGLLELSEGWLEDDDNEPTEIVGHFEAMKNKIVGAHVERSQALKSGGVDYDPQFSKLVEKSLADMVLVEKAIDKYILAANGGERDECWEALGELEEAAEAARESGTAVNAFLDDSPLVCMGCSSIGEEHICPKCDAERLKLDPNPRPEDERKHAVNDEVLAVYESYQEVLLGTGALQALVTNLQSLEFTYLEVEAIGEQTLTNESATERIKKTANEMLTAVRGVLKGIEVMHGVTETRATTQLNLGWEMILKNAVKAQELLVKMNQEVSTLQ